ncbi:MAG: phosphate acetyltransferase [Candidatus Aureabacteria bacterium]|nr:phosphate acetyltransferase [Candidatus Auribacterota bacterium]
MDFFKGVLSRVKAEKRIVLPESYDGRVIEAALAIQAGGWAVPVVLGKEKEIGQKLKGKVEIIDIEADDRKKDFIKEYVALRKHKGISEKIAEKFMKKPLFFGAMLLRKGFVDGMVAGSTATSADVIRAAIHVIGLREGINVASSSFAMIVPDCTYANNGKLIYADCGLVPDPSAEQLADIAIASSEMCRMLYDDEPVVAMLSFSTKGSAKHKILEKIIAATEIAKKKVPGLKIDGELQGDSALVPSIGRKKAPESNVAGKANVLIFPDLNSGNIAYKLTERLAKAQAYGPLIQGLARPVNDLSRGCSVQDIVTVAAITALEGEYFKKK